MEQRSKTQQTFSELKGVKLDRRKKQEIWHHLEREMSVSKPRKRRARPALSALAAAAAAVAIVAGGIGYTLNHHSNKGSATATLATGGDHQNSLLHPADVSHPPLPKGVSVQTYGSVKAAGDAVSKLQQQFGNVYPSGPLVDLGAGVKAKFAGAMGQYRYQWHEGKWTLNLMGTGASTGGTQVANGLTAYFHDHTVPVPHDRGTIIVRQSGTSSWKTTAAWQVGGKVYRVQQSGNPVNALKLIAKVH